MLCRQHVLQLFVWFYYLQSSVQMLNKREKFKKSTILTQPRIGKTVDVNKFTQIIQLLDKTMATVDPLSVWLVKDRYPTLETLRTNSYKMSSCIENHENLRLELVLLKILKGEAINVVIYGGSNSAQGMFPVIFRDWWSKVIKPISGSQLNLKIIGIGGTGSSYYQFCHGIYLEENETIDLAILETAVNDVLNVVVGESKITQSLPLEQLTRQLLKRPNNPAVFYVNLFILPSKKNPRCLNLVDYGQGLISELYAITTIHLRCVSCRLLNGKYYADTSTGQAKDGWHSKLLGHAQVAFMIIHVISKTFTKIARDMNRLTASDLSESWFNALSSKIPPLPSPVYIKGETSIIRSSKCWADLTSNRKETVIHNTLRLTLVKSFGFKYSKRVTGGSSYSAETVARTDAFGGLLATAINAEVTVLFTVASQSSEGSLSTGSVGFLSRYAYNGGTVEAWIDDRYGERVRIRLQRQGSLTAVVMLSTHVKPGKHTLTLRTVEKGHSILVGVFVGPSDWP